SCRDADRGAGDTRWRAAHLDRRPLPAERVGPLAGDCSDRIHMIEFEMRGETELIADLRDAPERVTKATKRALNRAIAAARTVMARAIARDTGIKVGDVRDRHLRMTE